MLKSYGHLANFSGRFKKTAFYKSRDPSWTISLFRKKNIFNFSRRVVILKAFRKKFSSCTWSYILRVRTVFWWNLFFPQKTFLHSIFGNWTENSRPFRETFRHGRQNCTLHFQKISLKRLWKFQSLILFRFCKFWPKMFQSWRIFSTGAWKLRCGCSEKHFGKIFFLKRKVCFIFFGLWGETFGPPGEHPSTALLKRYFTCPEKQTK